MRNTFVSFTVLALGAVLSACSSPPGSTPEATRAALTAASAAGGSYSCDFNLPATFNLLTVAPIVERDRMYMAAQPGFLRKHIPMRIDTQLGGQITQIVTGGRYLFDTYPHALAYDQFVRFGYVLDGVEFLHRSYFLGPECHVWSVVGATDLANPSSQQLMLRTERFSVPAGDQTAALQARYSAVLTAAEQRGYTAVWLVYDPQESLVELVYFKARLLGIDDVVQLVLLQTAPPLGNVIGLAGYTRVYNQTEWTLTLWSPFVAGDHGVPAAFPNSPVPLPIDPYCGDRVCEVSRGESARNCPADCPVSCGDAICQPAEGENTQDCPSDCRL